MLSCCPKGRGPQGPEDESKRHVGRKFARFARQSASRAVKPTQATRRQAESTCFDAHVRPILADQQSLRSGSIPIAPAARQPLHHLRLRALALLRRRRSRAWRARHAGVRETCTAADHAPRISCLLSRSAARSITRPPPQHAALSEAEISAQRGALVLFSKQTTSL